MKKKRLRREVQAAQAALPVSISPRRGRRHRRAVPTASLVSILQRRHRPVQAARRAPTNPPRARPAVSFQTILLDAVFFFWKLFLGQVRAVHQENILQQLVLQRHFVPVVLLASILLLLQVFALVARQELIHLAVAAVHARAARSENTGHQLQQLAAWVAHRVNTKRRPGQQAGMRLNISNVFIYIFLHLFIFPHYNFVMCLFVSAMVVRRALLLRQVVPRLRVVVLHAR